MCITFLFLGWPILPAEQTSSKTKNVLKAEFSENHANKVKLDSCHGAWYAEHNNATIPDKQH